MAQWQQLPITSTNAKPLNFQGTYIFCEPAICCWVISGNGVTGAANNDAETI